MGDVPNPWGGLVPTPAPVAPLAALVAVAYETEDARLVRELHMRVLAKQVAVAPPKPVMPPNVMVGADGISRPVEPPCPPLASSGEQIPVAMTKEDLKGPGTLATAIVAPKSGDLGVLAGTPVILMAHHLMDLPMVRNLLRVLYGAWTVFAGYVGFKIYSAGSVYGLDWNAVLRGGFDAAVVSALVAFGIVQRGKFNDPAVSSSLSGSAAADAAAIQK